MEEFKSRELTHFKSGYSKDIFLNNPPDMLICSICSGIFNNPTTCTNQLCGNTFCNHCIQQYLKSNGKCPSCKSESTLDNFVNNKIVNNFIESLTVCCITKLQPKGHVKEVVGSAEEECVWTGKISELDHHFKLNCQSPYRTNCFSSCSKNNEVCDNEDEESISRSSLDVMPVSSSSEIISSSVNRSDDDTTNNRITDNSLQLAKNSDDKSKNSNKITSTCNNYEMVIDVKVSVGNNQTDASSDVDQNNKKGQDLVALSTLTNSTMNSSSSAMNNCSKSDSADNFSPNGKL